MSVPADDLGYGLIKRYITQVKVSNSKGKWYVEYRLKNPRFYFDKWWWYDDSIHSNYSDAAVRAQVLAGLGYFEHFEKKKQFIIEVKGK